MSRVVAYAQQCANCTTTTPINIGLIACYPFNGNANDESGNGFNGSVYGAVLTSDRFANPSSAYSFNGSTQYIRLGDILDSVFARIPVAQFSVSGWAKTNTLTMFAGGGIMVGKMSGAGANGYQWSVNHDNDGRVRAMLANVNATNLMELQSATVIPTGQWFHFLITFDGSLPKAQRFKLYVNAVAGSIYKDIGSIGTTTTNTNQEVTIGSGHAFNNPASPNNQYNGSLDDIRIYNKVVSATEAVQLRDLLNPVKANAGADTTICLGDSVRLSASGGPRYAWQPSASVNNDTISNPYASPITTTDYIVTVTDGACSGKDTVKVTVALPVVANAGADRNMCLGDSVRLSAAGGVKYTWSPAASLSNDTIHDPYARPTVTTDYIVTVSNSACSDMDTVTVFVSNVVADAGTAGSICQGDSIQLSATGGTQYTWTPAASLSNPSVSNPFARPATTTVYHVQVSDGICTREDSVEITVISPGLLSAGADKIMCEKDSVQLQATGGANYKWYPAIGVSDTLSASPKVSPPVTTEYRVVSAVGACVSGDTVLVTVNPLPAIYAGADLTLCTGGQLTIPAIAVNADRYRWIPASGLDSTSVLRPRADPNATMQYIVEAENTLTGCLNYDTIIVNVNQPVASFMPDVTEGNAPLDVTFTNTSTATGGVHSWYFEDADTTYVTRDPKHRFSKPGTFRVSLLVTDDNGCVDTVSKLIRINDELKVFIPNVFTPNGDGLNDEFAIIYTQQALLGMKGSVWNRWGVKVYEFTMPGGAWWNGEDEGQKCPAGVYQYSIEVVNNRGQLRRYHGTITLVR